MELIKINFVRTISQLLIFIGIVSALEATLNTTDNNNSSDTLDDRFNFNLNLANAHGVGRHGGFSNSDAMSYGVNAGIRRPNGQYNNLYSNAGSNSNSFSSGFGAPLTFANSGSRVRPGSAGGNAGSGVFGGRGTASSFSHNQNVEIPLGDGSVLLSNLKERNSTTTSQKVESDDALHFS